MNCRDTKRLLAPFLEADLSDTDKAAVGAHLHGCDECQKEKAFLEKTWSMLDGLQAPVVGGDFTRNLMVKISEQPKRRFVPGVRILVPVMASVCVLIAVYFVIQNHPVREEAVIKEPLHEQASVVQVEREASLEPETVVASVAPVEPAKDISISAQDEEIIRNLDVYENIELYQNYALLNDLDVVENLGTKGL